MSDRKIMQPKQLHDIHKLYLDGEPYTLIAETLGIPLGRVQATILKQRTLNPIDWPKRIDESVKRTMGFKASDHIIAVSRYECTACTIYFNVEMSGEILELRVACPTCQDDEAVIKVGVGYMFDDTFDTSAGGKKKNSKKKEAQEKALSKAKAKAKIKIASDEPRTWKKMTYTDEQRAFICYMHDKLKNKEIAAILNRNETSIDRQILKARKEDTFEHYFHLGEELYKQGLLMDVIVI